MKNSFPTPEEKAMRETFYKRTMFPLSYYDDRIVQKILARKKCKEEKGEAACKDVGLEGSLSPLYNPEELPDWTVFWAYEIGTKPIALMAEGKTKKGLYENALTKKKIFEGNKKWVIVLIIVAVVIMVGFIIYRFLKR